MGAGVVAVRPYPLLLPAVSPLMPGRSKLGVLKLRDARRAHASEQSAPSGDPRLRPFHL
jgi:hypothetical protein